MIPSKAISPDDEAAYTEIIELIERLIRKLPSREKIIIKLHLFHDKRYQDIADMLGLPAGTVSSYVKRAKDKLKKELKDI